MATLMSTAATPRSAAMCGAAGAITVASRISMNMAPATSSAKPRETPPAGARGTGPATPSATVESFRRARITGGSSVRDANATRHSAGRRWESLASRHPIG